MEENQSKPRIIYFRWSLEKAPIYVKRLFDRIFIKGLSEFFLLTVVSENCNYGEICERYKPDITFFESGNNGLQDPPLRISNTSAFPHIPKIGFFRSDPMCPSRTIFFRDMDIWGVETFFTYSTPASEYTPEVKNNLFYWNFFVDTDVYQDYGQDKIIPILFSGSTGHQYEWREKMKPLISKYFPVLSDTHPGLDPKMALYDEKYCRLINTAFIAPTCGAMVKCLVNKHLEIPASKTCLLTEKTPVLEAAGFRDMVNCVFADEHDVVDKLDYLFKNQDVLQRITDNGYNFVRENHTVKQRGQIRQWFDLQQVLKPGQKIVQPSMFGDLTIVDENAAVSSPHIISGGADRILLQEGDVKLHEGQYTEAEILYQKALAYTPYMAEPCLRIGISYLYRGDANTAIQWILRPIKWLFSYNALEPNPVEWGYFLIALLCLGRLDEAVKNALAFLSLHRLELDRARWAVFTVAKMQKEAEIAKQGVEKNQPGFRRSIHLLPQWSFEESVKDFCKMFNACKQQQFCETIYHALGDKFSIEVNNGDNKKQSLLKALSLEPTNLNILLQLAILLHKQKNYKEADQYYNKAVTNHPDSVEAFASYGQLAIEISDVKGAQALFQRALALAPSRSDIRQLLENISERVN